MAIPDYQAVMLPLLRILADGSERRVRDVRDLVATEFNLSAEERDQLLPSGQATIIASRVGWAKTYLKNAGLIDNPSRGRLRITDAGLRVLAERPEQIDAKYLHRFPSFVAFLNKSKQDQEIESGDVAVLEADAPQLSPLEQLDNSYRSLRIATADDLLDRLKACSPTFFEHVVVKLLVAMGYGGISGEGFVTKASGDAGIDGVIKEDKLGLDVVCIQAKKWEGSVGRPVVQGFVGSMDYVRAKKGVIITTSTFSRDAVSFVEKIEAKKVVLVDGETLAQLMLDHDVGVTTTKVYSLKEVSQDFFGEDEG